ncbi:MAG: murein L,D-transpeptidase [Elusimicrobiota bacterium]
MKRLSQKLFFLILLVSQVVPGIASTEISDNLKLFFDQSLKKQGQILEASPYSSLLLEQFYKNREYHSAWINEGKIYSGANELLRALRQSDREGLRPHDYRVDLLQELIEQYKKSNTDNISVQLKLEIFLTDSFLTYGSHLLSGRLNPYKVDNEWFANRRTGDLPNILEAALKHDNLRTMLRDLLPSHPFYQRLKSVLSKYKTLQEKGGWPKIPEGRPIRKGDIDDRVPLLRKMLILTGDLNLRFNEKKIFDAPLERALGNFQKRHGLDEDGILGKSTSDVLRIPVEVRIAQLEANLERCRWLPADLGRRHIFVNIPDFRLQLYDNDHEAINMKVIVGRKMRRTPVFSSTMTYIVLNPPWNVPKKIAKVDILEHIAEEPDYLTKYGFEVFSHHGEKATKIDHTSVDWSKVDPEAMPYHFRQQPGAQNALGQIKFHFPNQFDVYLHDTPSRSLFQKTIRDFSSGCIRIEKPVELASYLLSGTPFESEESIKNALKKRANQTILIPSPIRIHLLYWTAWADEHGNVQFRTDLYGRDQTLIQALQKY